MWSTDNLKITTCSTCQHGRKEQSRPLFLSQSHLTVRTVKGITSLFLTLSLSLCLFVFLYVRLTVDWQFDGVKYNSEKK